MVNFFPEFGVPTKWKAVGGFSCLPFSNGFPAHTYLYVYIYLHIFKMGTGRFKRARTQDLFLFAGQGEEWLSCESVRQTPASSRGAQEADCTSWDFFASYN